MIANCFLPPSPAGRGWGRGLGLSFERRVPPPSLPRTGEGQLCLPGTI